MGSLTSISYSVSKFSSLGWLFGFIIAAIVLAFFFGFFAYLLYKQKFSKNKIITDEWFNKFLKTKKKKAGIQNKKATIINGEKKQ